MSQQCEICGKKPQYGNRISHAHNVPQAALESLICVRYTPAWAQPQSVCASAPPACAAVKWSRRSVLLHAQQLNIKNQICIRRDRSVRRALGSVAQHRWNAQLPFSPHSHSRNSFLPSLDDLAITDPEIERASPHPRAMSNFFPLASHPGIGHAHPAALLRHRAGAHADVPIHQPGRRPHPVAGNFTGRGRVKEPQPSAARSAPEPPPPPAQPPTQQSCQPQHTSPLRLSFRNMLPPIAPGEPTQRTALSESTHVRTPFRVWEWATRPALPSQRMTPGVRNRAETTVGKQRFRFSAAKNS